MVSIGSQFSVGEQSRSIREAFWRSGFSKCQNMSCSSTENGEKTIQSEDHVAGCRMNGDGYGTTVFTCRVCGWQTSFQYDEASEIYYYETEGYKRNPPEPKAPPKQGGSANTE